MRIKYILWSRFIVVGARHWRTRNRCHRPHRPRIEYSAAMRRHVATRVVQVSVTVHDDRGRPVTGLTKDDFVLMDQGQRQQIASFSEHKILLRRSVPPKATKRAPPHYPESARAQGIQGTVRLDTIIDTDGRVIETKYVSGPKELVQASIDCVKQWRLSRRY